jgi:hypothetical protein
VGLDMSGDHAPAFSSGCQRQNRLADEGGSRQVVWEVVVRVVPKFVQICEAYSALGNRHIPSVWNDSLGEESTVLRVSEPLKRKRIPLRRAIATAQ